jgi:hypothetical protein
MVEANLISEIDHSRYSVIGMTVHLTHSQRQSSASV